MQINKAIIRPLSNGTFAFDNGHDVKVCMDADDAGAELEEMLWPLVAPSLKARRAVIIRIEDMDKISFEKK